MVSTTPRTVVLFTNACNDTQIASARLYNLVSCELRARLQIREQRTTMVLPENNRKIRSIALHRVQHSNAAAARDVWCELRPPTADRPGSAA